MAELGAIEVVSLLVTTYGIVESGNQEQRQYQQKAKAEESNAKNRQIERKRNLIRALSEQNVKAGASGFSSGTGSSAQAIMLEDIKREKLDTAIDAGVTSQRASAYRTQGDAAKSYSLISAGGEVGSGIARSQKRGSTKSTK